MSRKAWKRGVLERTKGDPVPVKDTETRTEVYSSVPTFAATNVLIPTNISALGSEVNVLEDSTAANISEKIEEERLVMQQKPQPYPDNEAKSGRFQSHVNPAFQYEDESVYDNSGEGLENDKGYFQVDTGTGRQPIDHDTSSDAKGGSNPYLTQHRGRQQVHESRRRHNIGHSHGDTFTHRLDQTGTRAEVCEWQEDDRKSGHSHTDSVLVVVADTSDERDEENWTISDETLDNDSMEVNTVPPVASRVQSHTNYYGSTDTIQVAFTGKLPQWSDSIDGHRRTLSLSSTFKSDTDTSGERITDTGSRGVLRSQSMRLPPTTDPAVVRAKKPLLRELSFSDCDGRKARNYGALSANCSMPRRNVCPTDHEQDAKKDIPKHLKSELAAHLLTVMQKLLDRGKVRQVAVLEQGNSCMLASLPTWKLAHSDEVGLVKSVTSPLEAMLKITIGHETYTCFKHGADKIVGRCGDTVLVAETTASCVVVGLARDSVPGSCLCEVAELVRALLDNGW